MEAIASFLFVGKDDTSMKINVPLVCSECNSRNYHVKKEKTNTKRLELKKYCPKCKKTTIHKESR